MLLNIETITQVTSSTDYNQFINLNKSNVSRLVVKSPYHIDYVHCIVLHLCNMVGFQYQLSIHCLLI